MPYNFVIYRISMDEENKNPILESEEQPKKKRGRKPKAKPESQNLSEEQSVDVKPAKKRGRPKKLKETAEVAPVAEIPSGPQWRDVPVVENTDNDSESYSPESEIFVHSEENDAFAYVKTHKDDEDDNEDVPSFFSTSDDDLDPDAYRNNYDDDDDSSSQNDSPEVQDVSLPPDVEDDRPLSPDYDAFADAEAARQDKRMNRKNWKADKFNRQNNRQNNNQRFQQNQNRQNQNRQNQQNQKQKFQQNQNRQNQQNQNRQNQQNQKQKNKKQLWKPDLTEVDAMNPADLPECEFLKSTDSITQWVSSIFCGTTPVESQTLESTITEETIVDAQPQVESQTQPEVLPEPQPESPAEETVSPADIPLPEKTEDMSYWELLTHINDSHIEHSEKPQDTAEVPPAEIVPEQPEQLPEQQPEPDSQPQLDVDFIADKTFALPNGKVVESLEGYENFLSLNLKDLRAKFIEEKIPFRYGASKAQMLAEFFKYAKSLGKLVYIEGVLDVFGDNMGGAITFASDSYRLKNSSVYVPQSLIEKFGLQRGHCLSAIAAPSRPDGNENCAIAVKIVSVMGKNPLLAKDTTPFSELTPYYPTKRIILESASHNSKDNLSMRAVDLLTPIGFGQRALIVAPPRTGKTVLMQNMAKSIRLNNPEANLIVLLVDERPEEVTDFKRAIDAEVVASTFDQDASSHVHAAEMVISKARRMVEDGKDVVILLDSITRLARAYNALMPNGGRTMSGGVEANALQKPKKFFGSARNIEGGGSLTIIGTALVETGSKMDEVIFEEFKGTGNLELHLDRALSDKRIFPAINMEKSGTRKEELLYHPDELLKIYALRRAMKGVPATDAMEMLVQRLKKVKTNIEFLLGLNR